MIGFADGAAHGVLWLAALGAIMLAVIIAGFVNEQRWLRRRREVGRAFDKVSRAMLEEHDRQTFLQELRLRGGL